MSQFQTAQETFWAGIFGDEYTQRNQGNNIIANNLSLFSKVLSYTRSVQNMIEFGANIGLNLRAIKQLLPSIELEALEINTHAANELTSLGIAKVYNQSIFAFNPAHQYDFVLTKGFLIHLEPSALAKVYETLYQSSKKYICLIEYYNPSPVEVSYRGFSERLFKRDFAGEMLDCYKDLKLKEYGFVYRRDPNFAQDDVTWFLLEK
jgi:pseudaminic acid biosynthesis-associated methylase